MMIVRLSHVSLTDQVGDPEDRYVTPMSTLIDSPEWHFEATWDGACIGDVQVYRNYAINQNGARKNTEQKDEKGEPIPMADDWRWWGGVPRGKIRVYRLLDRSLIKPAFLDEENKLPFSDGKREAEPRKAGEKAAPRAASV